MSRKNRDQESLISEDTQALFSDLRDTLRGETTEVIPTAADAAKESAPETVPLPAASRVADSPIPPSAPDWRSAEAPPAQAPSGQAAPEMRTSAPARPQTPQPPQAWVTRPAPRRTVRVGLLVWSAMLIMMGILVFSRLLIPIAAGPVIIAFLLASFGMVLIVAAFTLGRRVHR